MNLERLGSITSELSSNLLKSLVLPPGGLRGLFSRNRPLTQRERARSGRPDPKPDDGLDVAVAAYPAGSVILIGGFPAPDEAVVQAVHLSGGRSARVAVIPLAAALDPAAAAADAIRVFTRFGMKKVEVFDLDAREKATDPAWSARLAEYDAVVLCGDSPAKGLEVLQATLAAVTLREMVQSGKLLVGLEAGAAILGSRVFPSAGEEAVTAGLAVLPGLLIDTAFSQCSRFSRLAKAMATQEAALMLGAGLDAGVALVVTDGEAKVLGETSATFLDPRDRSLVGDDASSGLKVHLLTDGYQMNLRIRRAVPPEQVVSLVK